jgi:hypothetical protein
MSNKIPIHAILNSKPDYSHLNLNPKGMYTNLSKSEQETMLEAYDRGLNDDSPETLQNIDYVISKLKDKIHP